MDDDQENPSLRRRRRASQNLSRLSIPNDGRDFPDGAPSLQEVEEETRSLFQNFVAEEIGNQGLTPPEFVSPVISTPGGYENPKWAKAGKTLRIMADDFQKTKEREKIRKEAEAIDMEELTQSAFLDLLNEAFVDNVTHSRVLFVFFFCTDIAIRALRQRLDRMFSNIFEWSMEFLSHRMARWVQENGGWSVVLNQSLGYMKYIGVGVILLGVLLVARHIYKKITA